VTGCVCEKVAQTDSRSLFLRKLLRSLYHGKSSPNDWATCVIFTKTTPRKQPPNGRKLGKSGHPGFSYQCQGLASAAHTHTLSLQGSWYEGVCCTFPSQQARSGLLTGQRSYNQGMPWKGEGWGWVGLCQTARYNFCSLTLLSFFLFFLSLSVPPPACTGTQSQSHAHVSVSVGFRSTMNNFYLIEARYRHCRDKTGILRDRYSRSIHRNKLQIFRNLKYVLEGDLSTNLYFTTYLPKNSQIYKLEQF
jgi:hypothetical protein